MEVDKKTLQDHTYSFSKNTCVKTVTISSDQLQQDHNYSSPPKKDCCESESEKRILKVEHSYSSAAENITNIGDIESRRTSERDHSYMRVIKNFCKKLNKSSMQQNDHSYAVQ